jgi:hypothetical protein
LNRKPRNAALRPAFGVTSSTSRSKRRRGVEEKFRNIEIRQDGDLGLVNFNYDFVINDKVHHSGLEHWQLCKIDGSGRSCPLPGRPIFTADSQQRSREQGELMPGDCAGPLKKEKRMVISAPSARGKGNSLTY